MRLRQVFRNAVKSKPPFTRTIFTNQKQNAPIDPFGFGHKVRASYDPFVKNSIRGKEPRTKTGGWSTITVMPGVGIGPELMDVMMQVLKTAGAKVYFEMLYPEKGEEEFLQTIQSIRRNGVAIKANIEQKSIGELQTEPSKNIRLRKVLDLYADVIECRTFPGLEHRMKIHPKIDIVIVRQNTEGEYALLEHIPVPKVVQNLQVITRFNTKRICEQAFKYAAKHGRKKVTLLHTQDVLPLIDSTMKDTFDSVASKHPKIKGEKHSINHGLKMLMKNSEIWDVVITNSVLGTMLVTIMFGVVGGPALISGMNFSDRYQVFEPPFRNKGLGIAGMNIANPTAVIMCGVKALESLGHKVEAKLIQCCLEDIYKEGKLLTKDVGGTTPTSEFTKSLLARIRDKNKRLNSPY